MLYKGYIREKGKWFDFDDVEGCFCDRYSWVLEFFDSLNNDNKIYKYLSSLVILV